MKKIIAFALICVMLLTATVAFASCNASQNQIIVHTNAFFAPFEYYDGTEIKGVDVDIMNMVAEKLGKTVKFENVEFSAIIDNVSSGALCDAGAAGITITEQRKEKVDFSIPYYTSVQYVVFSANASIETKTSNGVEYIVWEALKGMTIGTQTDTTGWIYTDGEINATADSDYGFDGVLYGTNTVLKAFESAQLAADGIGSNLVDVVIVDELPAQYIVNNGGSGLKCLPLYYSGVDGEADAPVEEEYAICVTKGNDELLTAINQVLTELMVKDENGVSQIDKMVMKHMNLD